MIQDEIPVENFIALFGRKPVVVWHDQSLGETLTTFRQERAHMAIVRDVMSEGGVSYRVNYGLIWSYWCVIVYEPDCREIHSM